MKNMISLLAVAVLAVTFAAGCGNKQPDCASFKDAAECQKENNKFACKWTTDATDPKKGTCELRSDNDICATAAASEDDCKKAATVVKEGSCEMKNNVCAHKAK